MLNFQRIAVGSFNSIKSGQAKRMKAIYYQLYRKIQSFAVEENRSIHAGVMTARWCVWVLVPKCVPITNANTVLTVTDENVARALPRGQ